MNHRNLLIAIPLLSATLALPLTAAAQFPWDDHSTCSHQSQIWNLQKTKIINFESSCRLVPLTLGAVPGGTGWTGGYSREALVEKTYRIDHYDRCSGVLVGSLHKTDRLTETIMVNIENPNVGEDHSSYIRQDAPLTDDEARRELPVAKKRCENLQPGTTY